MLRWCVLSYYIIYLLNAFNCDIMLGPADLIFKKMEPCEGIQNIISVNITPKKFNRTHYGLDIEVDSPYAIGEQTEIELKGSSYKDGGWKPGSFYMKKNNVCEVLKVLLGDAFVALLNDAGADECPFPKGRTNLYNATFDNEKFNVPTVYGENKMEVFITIDEEIQCCLISYFEMIPKTMFR